MPDPDFISYLKTLQPEDWHTMATSKWTVKDVVAHMVAWEKASIDAIRETWANKKWPDWFVGNYDDFNARALAHYKDHTPTQLIEEWELWQKKVEEEVERFGEEKLRAHPDLFDWLFEGVDDAQLDGTESHYQHHYNQIKKAIENISTVV